MRREARKSGSRARLWVAMRSVAADSVRVSAMAKAASVAGVVLEREELCGPGDGGGPLYMQDAGVAGAEELGAGAGELGAKTEQERG